VRLWVNGTLMQNYNTSDMAHKIPRCIEWVSSIHPLEPGDVLALGTNHRGLNPFQDGDLVELETEPLGRLRVKIRDDLKRTWARETRLHDRKKGWKCPPRSSLANTQRHRTVQDVQIVQVVPTPSFIPRDAGRKEVGELNGA
jgi:hypothetical protein